MMPLQEQLSDGEWLDYNRFEFLKGIGDMIQRIDECHPDTLNDSFYIFNIWLKDMDDEKKFVHGLNNNIMLLTTLKPNYPPPWQFQIHTTGFGYVSVWTWL